MVYGGNGVEGDGVVDYYVKMLDFVSWRVYYFWVGLVGLRSGRFFVGFSVKLDFVDDGNY